MALYYIRSMPAALSARKVRVEAANYPFYKLNALLATRHVQNLILKDGFQNVQRL